MRVAVIGSNSMVGRHLQSLRPEWHYGTRNEYGSLSISNNSMLNCWLATIRPDFVVHLAAKVGGIVDNNNHKYEYLQSNVNINNNVIQAAVTNKVPNLVACLSTCVYADKLLSSSIPPNESQIHEGSPHWTNFGYGFSKRLLAAQIDCLKDEFKNYNGYNYIIPCNLYGPYDHRGETAHFCSQMIDKVINAIKNNDKSIEFFGRSTTKRQYMYAGDLARIIVEHVENSVQQSYNVAYPNLLSCEDMARITLDIANRKDIELVWKSAGMGQSTREVSIEKFKLLYPNFKFTSFVSGAIEVYNKWQSN